MLLNMTVPDTVARFQPRLARVDNIQRSLAVAFYGRSNGHSDKLTCVVLQSFRERAC